MGAVGSYPTISPLPGLPKEQSSLAKRHWRCIFCGAHVGLLRLGVTQHPALWSPDFPLIPVGTSDHPAYSLAKKSYEDALDIATDLGMTKEDREPALGLERK